MVSMDSLLRLDVSFIVRLSAALFKVQSHTAYNICDVG